MTLKGTYSCILISRYPYKELQLLLKDLNSLSARSVLDNVLKDKNNVIFWNGKRESRAMEKLALPNPRELGSSLEVITTTIMLDALTTDS